MIECNVIVDPPAVRTPSGAYRAPSGGPLYEGGGEKGGFDPKDLQSAYKIPTTGGASSTVAIIDAYGYGSAESDLAKYRSKYGLGECTKSSGCFKKVNEKGEEKTYPAEGGGLEVEWSLESALDMDMVSAACPKCKILLVEATTQNPADTAASVEEAAKLGATAISNSYGYPENNETWCPAKKGCAEYLSAYDQSSIPVTVSSGDRGYDNGEGAPNWPATSPNVIAVGGTTLKKAENTRGWTETAWSLSGSGCSLYESKPAWQTDTGCTKRTDNDVAAVADPETPVSVYNTPYASGWINVGGTSASAPLIAGMEGQAEKAVRSLGAEIFYDQPNEEFDVTSGSNGSCGGSYLCTAKTGYDGPTGMGAPDGIPTRGAAENSSPSAVLNSPSGAEQTVFYVNAKNEVADWNYTTSWANGVLGGAVKSNTSPAAIRTANGDDFVYYVNSSGEVAYFVNNGKWSGAKAIGGKVASNSSPTVVAVTG